MEKVDVRNRHDQSTPGSIDGPSPRIQSRLLFIDYPIPRPHTLPKRTGRVDGRNRLDQGTPDGNIPHSVQIPTQFQNPPLIIGNSGPNPHS